MKNFKKKSFKGSNPFLPDEKDLPNFLLNPKSNLAAKTKLKQANLKGYIDLSNTRLDNIPEEVFKPNTSVDGINWWLNVDISKIDASNNNLCENNFDNDGIHDFRNIPFVKILNLSSNKFNFIPMSIFYLKNLVFFDISNNSISMIDENLFANLDSLRNLNLSGNKLKVIPSTIKYMNNLQELNFSKNEICIIPNESIFLKYLKKLNLGWNKIQFIQPNFFNNLVSLEELYFNNNLLTNNINNINSYPAFDSILNLKILDISNNQYQDYIIFRNLPNLEILNISYNKLNNIAGLNLCDKLYEINCSYNLFKEIPDDFISIKNLRSLNIKGNDLNNLPILICLMDNLSELNIEGNPMKQNPNLKYANIQQIKQYFLAKLSETDINNIPENLKNNYLRKINNNNNYNSNKIGNSNIQINRNSPIFNFIKNNSELIITNSELIEIPIDEIHQNIPEHFLTSINLSGNNIERGLENFGNILYLLKSVKSINLAKNNIKYFPINILTLPLLEELNLSRNFLSYFPSENINQMNTLNITQSLEILNLSNNKLEELPFVINFFKNLKILDLTCNKIKDLNYLQNIKLEKLEKFLIDDNQISEIPQNTLFKSIPNVETFTISNNNLRDIPTDLFLLIFLENINFYGNYIRKIHNEYLLNANKIKDYLKKYHVYTNEQKYFELEQLEKLNQKKILKEKERLSKISPNYNSSAIENYFNSNFNNNDIFGKRRIIGDVFGSSNNNNLNNINNNNNYINKKRNNNNNENQINKNVNELLNINKPKRSLEEINKEIYEIESEMQSPGIQPHIKASLKKKFIGLIRERANLNN